MFEFSTGVNYIVFKDGLDYFLIANPLYTVDIYEKNLDILKNFNNKDNKDDKDIAFINKKLKEIEDID
jgi:hypothetical protein